jgi:hypothetical protein
MRKLTVLILTLVVLLVPQAIFASNGISNKLTQQTRLEAQIEAREEKLLQLQENVQVRNQVRTASREAKMNQLKQGIVEKYYQQMSNRMWATIERLDTLILRIENRVAIVDSQTDKDMSKIIADVTKAKTLLNDTKLLLTSSDKMIDDVITSNTPKDAYAILKTNIVDIKTNLKEVHRLLVKVIGDITGLHVGETKITPAVTP